MITVSNNKKLSTTSSSICIFSLLCRSKCSGQDNLWSLAKMKSQPTILHRFKIGACQPQSKQQLPEITFSTVLISCQQVQAGFLTVQNLHAESLLPKSQRHFSTKPLRLVNMQVGVILVKAKVQENHHMTVMQQWDRPTQEIGNLLVTGISYNTGLKRTTA